MWGFHHYVKRDVCVCLCVSCCEGAVYWSRPGDRISAFTEKHRPGPAAAHGPCNWTDLLWKWWVKLFLQVSELTVDHLKSGLLGYVRSVLDVSPVGPTIPFSFFASVLTQFSFLPQSFIWIINARILIMYPSTLEPVVLLVLWFGDPHLV